MPIFSLSSLVDSSLTIGTQTIALDGITEVSSSNSRMITQHPVEQGYNISDAQHFLPIKATFKAWITDNPQSTIDERVFANIQNSIGLNLIEGNVKKQLDKIEAEANKGGLVTVKTKYAKYEDFFCESFSYTESTQTGILINFSIIEKQDTADKARGTANFDTNKIGLWS
jgi:hypothetical protein